MSRNTRVVLLLAAAAVAIAAIAVVALGGGDDGKDSTTAAQSTPATTGSQGTSTTAAPPQPSIPVVQVKDGKAVGGATTISVKSGDRARFKVTSDEAHEIHLHGFDVAKDVPAGGSVRFDVKADAPGIYEVEIEDTGTKIGQVKVEP